MSTDKVIGLIKDVQRNCKLFEDDCTISRFSPFSPLMNLGVSIGVYQSLVETILDAEDMVLHTCTSLDELMQQLDIQENTAAILCLL